MVSHSGYSGRAGGAGARGGKRPINPAFSGKAGHTNDDTTVKPDEERRYRHPLPGPVHRGLPHPPHGGPFPRIRAETPRRRRRRPESGGIQGLLAVGGGEGGRQNGRRGPVQPLVGPQRRDGAGVGGGSAIRYRVGWTTGAV